MVNRSDMILAVAPMGVNIAEIKRSSPYKPWQEGSPCKIFAGDRLNPVKGHKYLIETVELLRNRGLDVRLQQARTNKGTADITNRAKKSLKINRCPNGWSYLGLFRNSELAKV